MVMERMTIPCRLVAKTRRNLEADVTLFCDVLCDTDLQRVFAPDDREQVLAVYGPVHARLLRQALELIADAESARKKVARPEIRFLMRLALVWGAPYPNCGTAECERGDDVDGVRQGIPRWVDERGDIRNAQIVKAVLGHRG